MTGQKVPADEWPRAFPGLGPSLARGGHQGLQPLQVPAGQWNPAFVEKNLFQFH